MRSMGCAWRSEQQNGDNEFLKNVARIFMEYNANEPTIICLQLLFLKRPDQIYRYL